MLRHPYRLAIALLLFGLAFGQAQDAKDKGKDKEKFTPTKEEQEIVDYTNAERAKLKLPALTPDPLLFKCAHLHSENQAKQKMLAHVLDGKNWENRIDAVGYDWKHCAENLSQINTWDAKKVVSSWMTSKDHRPNIVDKESTQIGIGIVKKDGIYYITQVFATPQDK